MQVEVANFFLNKLSDRRFRIQEKKKLNGVDVLTFEDVEDPFTFFCEKFVLEDPIIDTHLKIKP
jgi:hypothetical protein